MRTVLRILAIGFMQLYIGAGQAGAQYMYLDSNGDGAHSSEDRLNPNGTPTTVDVFLSTNHNRDGSPALCDTGDGPLSIVSYATVLHAVNGTVAYASPTNRIPNFGNQLLNVNPDGINLLYAMGGAQIDIQPPGSYRLFTVTITATAGSPVIEIQDFFAGNFTAFGTNCSGNDFDNTYKLTGGNGGSDWTDVDGLGIREGGNSVPRLSVPGFMSSQEGHEITITATSTDPDAGDVLTVTVTGAPSFLTFHHSPGVSPVTAVLSGVAGFADAGNYTIRWTLSDGGGYDFTATTFLAVGTTDRAPRLVPLNDVSLSEGATIAVPVSASDPDGNAISVYAALPSFATLAQPTAGTASVSTSISVSPDYASAGDYTVQVIASAGCTSDVGSFHIHVTNVDRPPTIQPVEDVSVAADSILTIPMGASDPDGDVVSLSASLPSFASLGGTTSGAGSLQATVAIAPSEADEGSHPATLTATAGALSSNEAFSITVTVPNRAPVIGAPASLTAQEGQAVEVAVTATDPDGETGATLTAEGLPVGATFTSEGADAARLSWTPDYSQSGSYSVLFHGEDRHGAQDSATTRIEIAGVNRSPTASPGGPYTGTTGALVHFDGSGSVDPDGDKLTGQWDFGDGMTAVGITAGHMYQSPGAYAIVFEADDGAATVSAGTSATIEATLSATSSLAAASSTIHLGSSATKVCAQIEPEGGAFLASEIDPASIVLRSSGTGSVDHAASLAGKTVVEADRDGDGIGEIVVCFSMDDVRRLFDGLPGGTTTVSPTIEGSVPGRGVLSAPIAMNVDAGEPDGAPSLAPNPMNPQGLLSFSTQTAGKVRVQIFDARGRLVRTLLDSAARPAGHQYLRFDGRDDRGGALGSGVYLYRIETPNGVSTGRVTIMK